MPWRWDSCQKCAFRQGSPTQALAGRRWRAAADARSASVRGALNTSFPAHRGGARLAVGQRWPSCAAGDPLASARHNEPPRPRARQHAKGRARPRDRIIAYFLVSSVLMRILTHTVHTKKMIFEALRIFQRFRKEKIRCKTYNTLFYKIRYGT